MLLYFGLPQRARESVRVRRLPSARAQIRLEPAVRPVLQRPRVHLMRKVLAHAGRRVVSPSSQPPPSRRQRRKATVAPRRLRPEADEAAIVRLVDAVLLEQNDEVAVKRAR